MAIHIGLDIGGTKLMVAAANANGAILRRARRPTPLGLADGIAALHEMTAEVAAGERIASIGAAAGGWLDWRTGIISPLHQPEWRGVPLKDIFEQAYGCPLWVDVDTNVAALGEYQFGGARPDRLFYMTISTGVGGGYLIHGQIYRGMGGAHPEVGHHAIPHRCRYPERVVCDCGAAGCIEALISGSGIKRIYGKPAENLAPDEWVEVGDHLGMALRNVAVIYLPDVIVLGGGVAVGGGETFIGQARDVMTANLKTTPVPEVRLSNLGYDTALLGAIALAMEASRR